MLAAWQLLISKHLLPRRSERRVWKPTGAALRLINALRKDWKRQARGIETASVGGALTKADIHLARIALVIAEADKPEDTTRRVVAGQIERAAMIVNYTIDCWRALPEQGGLALSRRDEQLDHAITRLIAWLEEHGDEATQRELQRAHVAGARTAEDLKALLQRYEATYPGSVATVTPERGGIPTVVVKAPRRKPSKCSLSSVSPSGDTGENEHEKSDRHWGFDAVTGGDTGSGDTVRGQCPEPQSDDPQPPAPSMNGTQPPCSRHPGAAVWRLAAGGPPQCGKCHEPVDGIDVEWITPPDDQKGAPSS